LRLPWGNKQPDHKGVELEWLTEEATNKKVPLKVLRPQMLIVAGPAGTVAEALLALSANDRGKPDVSCHQYPGP
jgi:hypothetical protein